jgi:hypothetical protein
VICTSESIGDFKDDWRSSDRTGSMSITKMARKISQLYMAYIVTESTSTSFSPRMIVVTVSTTHTTRMLNDSVDSNITPHTVLQLRDNSIKRRQRLVLKQHCIQTVTSSSHLINDPKMHNVPLNTCTSMANTRCNRLNSQRLHHQYTSMSTNIDWSVSLISIAVCLICR